jgi:hypothetical protein
MPRHSSTSTPHLYDSKATPRSSLYEGPSVQVINHFINIMQGQTMEARLIHSKTQHPNMLSLYRCEGDTKFPSMRGLQ